MSMASRSPHQLPHVDYHRDAGLFANYLPESDLPDLTSLEKTEEPCGRKLLLRFRMKKNSPDDGALVSGQAAKGKVESLEVIKVQPSQLPSPSESTQLGIVAETPNAAAKVMAATKRNQKKRGFSFALSNEEIEADILAVSGMKPKRQPKKKRSKKVPKELDYLFPGFGLML